MNIPSLYVLYLLVLLYLSMSSVALRVCLPERIVTSTAAAQPASYLHANDPLGGPSASASLYGPLSLQFHCGYAILSLSFFFLFSLLIPPLVCVCDVAARVLSDENRRHSLLAVAVALVPDAPRSFRLSAALERRLLVPQRLHP